MPTYTPKKMAAVTLTTAADVYTAPAGGAIVNSITVAAGATARAVTIKVAGKFLLNAGAIAAKETIFLAPNHALVSGDTINAAVDAGTDVDLIASGVEIT